MPDWERDQSTRGPADWDWQQAAGALLLAIGLLGVGFLSGMSYQLWLLAPA